MNIKTRLFRGLTLVFAFLLVISVTLSIIMEKYRTALDENTGSVSQETVISDNAEDWTYSTQFTSTKDAVDSMREFAIREAAESLVLLKNTNNSLPLTQERPKVTLFGIRSYAPYYGSTTGGSIPDKGVIDHDANKSTLETDFKEVFDVNPAMIQAYEDYCADFTWGSSGFGAQAPQYQGLYSTTDPTEPTLSELGVQSNDLQYDQYNDAAIVILGRVSGEGSSFYPGEEGLGDGITTDSGNILGISDEEWAIIEEAKKCSSNVIVLINSTNQMDIEGLKQDPDIDSVMWIGNPGVYGFAAVAQALLGDVNPSGHLGDIYAVNSALAPAMMNYGLQYVRDENGNITKTYPTGSDWTNAASYSGMNVNSYLVEAEGIYTGYRYYETRYADSLLASDARHAVAAKAGTYVNYDLENMTFMPATTDGSWNYSHEVSYPFGYGLSYTTFTQELTSVEVSDDHKTAVATVKVTNTGDVAGKSVVQLYAQVPYTAGGVEKSAIQLVDYEKTDELAKGASETVTLNIDMTNLTSYNSEEGDGAYVLDAGTYYFAVGESSHDALNNILAEQDVTGMVNTDGTAFTATSGKVKTWTLSAKDADTFDTSVTGYEIKNQLSEGDYATDVNAWGEDITGFEEVTYLSRSNWNGTFPKTYTGFGIEAGSRLEEIMKNDFIDLKNDNSQENINALINGDSSVDLTLADMEGAPYEDARWAELVSKIPLAETINFMASAFHNLEYIPSVGFGEYPESGAIGDIGGYQADDGPGGSDSHNMSEAKEDGIAFEDADEYSWVGTRVAPAPVNLAYTWNKEIAYENGQLILGESTLLYQLPIMIGPGMNIHRTAYNGRNVEYYSEDPILSGFTGSAVVQGAQSKGCLVNIKHVGFNTQEANRSGVCELVSEQAARELELRNLQQAFTGFGRSSKMEGVEAGATPNRYAAEGARGTMTAYNRIGMVASSANYGVQVEILRNEWGFKGYSVTDFTGLNPVAAPKESILAGTTAFCGFGANDPYINLNNLNAIAADADLAEAIQEGMHYVLYAISNSYGMDLMNNIYTVSLNTWWRSLYTALITVSAILLAGSAAAYVVFTIKDRKSKEEE